MKNATKKMIEKELVPYVKFDGIFPYIQAKHISGITSKLLASYSNIYCGISGENTECPVFIVKSSTRHTVFAKIVLEYN